jgi:hypothetical protein
MVDLKINTGERKSNDSLSTIVGSRLDCNAHNLLFDRRKKEKEIGSRVSFRSLLAMIGCPKALKEGRFRYDSATLFGVVGARQANRGRRRRSHGSSHDDGCWVRHWMIRSACITNYKRNASFNAELNNYTTTQVTNFSDVTGSESKEPRQLPTISANNKCIMIIR